MATGSHLKLRSLRPAQENRISKPAKLDIDCLDIRDYRLLLEQALNARKPLLLPKEGEQLEHGKKKQLDAVLKYGFRLAQQPASLFHSRAQEMGPMLTTLPLCGNWQTLIPARLGYEDKIDLATHAVTIAYRNKLETSTPGLTERAYRQYECALSIIRSSIDTSESSLIAVMLLSFFEFLVEISSPSQIRHCEGVWQILRARRQAGLEPTEFERCIIFGDSTLRNRDPIVKGIASPFEDLYWLDLEPPAMQNVSSAVLNLQKATHKLLIRLPRLVASVRALRQSLKNPYSASPQDTVKLADDLLNLRDDAAESEILHRVSVVETKDGLDRGGVTPYSFEYVIFKEMDICLTYWRMRVVILRICLVLYNLPQTADGASATFRMAQAAMKTKLEDLISNMIMSRQYALKSRIYGPLRFVDALCVAWGATLSIESWRGTDMSFLRYWILKRFNEASHRPRKATAAFLDEEAEVIIGGPLKGC